jgi:TatD DNase family protein
MMLVDSHCHLDFPDFEGEVDGVIERARHAGVGLMLTVSTTLKSFERGLDIAKRHDCVFCSLGVHPHEVDAEVKVELGRLIELADHPKVVGIGETGLDFHYVHSSREGQEASFRTHIAAARETGLPLIVHSRDADEDTLRILREEQKNGDAYRGVFHCFGGSRDLANAAIDLGFHISFSGILTFKKADAVREVARSLPVERLLVETDSPYLAPVPCRGRRNEPALVTHVAAVAAELKEIEPEALADQTTKNFLALFNKIPELACV